MAWRRTMHTHQPSLAPRGSFRGSRSVGQFVGPKSSSRRLIRARPCPGARAERGTGPSEFSARGVAKGGGPSGARAGEGSHRETRGIDEAPSQGVPSLGDTARAHQPSQAVDGTHTGDPGRSFPSHPPDPHAGIETLGHAHATSCPARPRGLHSPGGPMRGDRSGLVSG